MSDTVTTVEIELAELGYKTSTRESPKGTVVEFEYEVEVGTHRGQAFRMGVDVSKAGYPEYPPYWVHVSPPVNDGRGGAVDPYTTEDGREWVAMSRPPSDIWDKLPDKNMEAYLNEHIRRFWSHL